MKYNGFEIKISDMLTSKVTDTLDFDHKMLSELKNLDTDGVSGTLTIQSLDHESLFVTLDELRCSCGETCDRCGKGYKRPIAIEGYTAKYVTHLENDIRDSEEEILLIDTKNGVIDIEELIYHAIQLQEPFVKYCPKCANLRWEEEILP